MQLRRYCAPILLATLFSCCAFALPATAQSEAERIEELLSQYHDYRLFNGSALVAKDGEVIFRGGFGEADMSWEVPNETDTRFRIASVTKQFTAALILSLVQSGDLELDAPIVEYLPDYPPAQGARVTVHHLLSHTSGIPSYTSLPGFMSENIRDPYEPDSLLALFAEMDLLFDPGTRWAYSNSGYILLGAIVEAVTGRPYAEAFRERILEPAGLEDTGYDDYGQILERRATGYVRTPAGYERAPYLDTSVPYAAGMLYSTVGDLYAWDQLLYSNALLRDSTRELAFAPHASLPPELARQVGLPPHYGYGWFVGPIVVEEDSVQVVQHGGSIFGFRSGFWRMPQEGHTIILLDNTSADVSAIGRGILAILYGDEPERPARPISDLVYERIESEGPAAAEALYRRLSERKPAEYDFAEEHLNTLGYFYLGRDDLASAIAVFKLNVEAYPDSWNVYDSLGEAYATAGERAQAIENYRKALELNPESTHTQRMLRQLGVRPQGD